MLPNMVMKNQYGEVSNNFIKEGSSAFIWCNFIVDKTNGNGLGIRSLKSSGRSSSPDIANVFMATSATPASNNPNPQAGIILVEFTRAYAGYINGGSGTVVPLSGSNINVTSALTVGDVYVVTAVGTTTLAGWQSLGWLGNALPTVGASFVAITATPTTGTGVVQQPAAAGDGVGQIKVIGDPNQSVISLPTPNLICGVFGPTSSSVTTPELVTPVNNTVIGLSFVLINVAGPLI